MIFDEIFIPYQVQQSGVRSTILKNTLQLNNYTLYNIILTLINIQMFTVLCRYLISSLQPT